MEREMEKERRRGGEWEKDEKVANEMSLLIHKWDRTGQNKIECHGIKQARIDKIE